jgi:hypothetical protein
MWGILLRLAITTPQFHLHLQLPSAHFTAPCNSLHLNFTCICICHPHTSLTLEIPTPLFSLGTVLAIRTFHLPWKFLHPYFHLGQHLLYVHFTAPCNYCTLISLAIAPGFMDHYIGDGSHLTALSGGGKMIPHMDNIPCIQMQAAVGYHRAFLIYICYM